MENSGSLVPPSVGGRFSNGPTFAEIIGQDFPVSVNMGLGGATAGTVNTNTYPLPVFDNFRNFENQIATFAGSGGAAVAGANPLTLVMMGSNDIFQKAALPGFDIADTVDDVITGIKAIAALGAQFDDFIVPFLPGASGSSPYVPLRQAYNALLLARVPELEALGLNIILPNLDLASARILADPAAFGITNTTDPCTQTVTAFSIDNCTFIGFSGPVPQFDISLADGYFLIDGVHPGKVVHQEWAKEVLAAVEADISPVPLPAGGLLLLTGLGAAALIRRRA